MSFECIDVEKLYAKDDTLKKNDVQILQEWLEKQPHLPHLKEMQVAVFLHSCYYRIEAAKTTIDNYFTLKTCYPELFDSLPEDTLRNVLSVIFFNTLPKKTPQGYIVALLKLVDFAVDKFSLDYTINVINMVSTLHMHQHGFETGVIIVFDCKGFTFSHLARLKPSSLKHAMDHLQEGAPVRIKGIRLINTIPVMDKFIAIMKPFMKNEIFNMLQMHSSFDTFYKCVPRECMPEDYGGDGPSCRILSEQNLGNLINNYDFFKWHDTQKVDESERLEKSYSNFGVEGTFKKLEID